MKKATSIFMILSAIALFSMLFLVNIRQVDGNGDYSITHVNHAIALSYNGYVLMNDTIYFSGQTPSTFLFGIPYGFGEYVLRCRAYDAGSQANTYTVNLDEPIENRSGFYGLEIDLSDPAPQNLTVEVLFSNGLMTQNSQNTTLFSLAFPAYPSLIKPVASCNASITLPSNSYYYTGTVANLTYTTAELPALTYNVSTITFNSLGEELQIFDVDTLDRAIRVNEFSQITCSDSYQITNKGSQNMEIIKIVLPYNASDINAEFQDGRTIGSPRLISGSTNRYTVNLTKTVGLGKSFKVIIHYSLLESAYIESQSASVFSFEASLFPSSNYYFNETTVSFTFPEGASIQTFKDTLANGHFGIDRDVFTESATVTKQGMATLDNFNVQIAYSYNNLWVAFRPTTWVLFLSIVGCIAIVLVRRIKAPIPVTVTMPGMKPRPEYITSFVNTYEEKLKAFSEIDSLEAKAQKGRIPRRRYKVQRRMLEAKIDTLSRNLDEHKERMRSLGGHYANLIRELDIAEVEMNEVDSNLRSIEGRYNRGEISLEAYRKKLGDYQRMKEKTQTNMNGILLRLREETRQM